MKIIWSKQTEKQIQEKEGVIMKSIYIGLGREPFIVKNIGFNWLNN
jgi:hypothetical protein